MSLPLLLGLLYVQHAALEVLAVQLSHRILSIRLFHEPNKGETAVVGTIELVLGDENVAHLAELDELFAEVRLSIIIVVKQWIERYT